MTRPYDHQIATKRWRSSWTAFGIGLVLALGGFILYGLPVVTFLRTGSTQWSGIWLVGRGTGQVDIGPAVILTAGFMFLYAARRSKDELLSWLESHLRKTAGGAAEGSTERDASVFMERRAVYVRWLTQRWVLRWFSWVGGLFVAVALVGLAWWTNARGVFDEPVFGVAVAILAVFPVIRLFLDWTGLDWPGKRPT